MLPNSVLRQKELLSREKVRILLGKKEVLTGAPAMVSSFWGQVVNLACEEGRAFPFKGQKANNRLAAGRLSVQSKNSSTVRYKTEDIMSRNRMSRRQFVGLTTTGIAGALLSSGTPAYSGAKMEEWDPDKPLIVTGKHLTIQPVLMHAIHERRESTSWRSWGTTSSYQAVADEAKRISDELKALSASAQFPLRILPLVTVASVEAARRVHATDYDVVMVYPATGSGSMLRACFPERPERNTLIFVRHRSGPIYYWYEALSTRYLKKGTDEQLEQNTLQNHGGVFVHDVVVDDYEEVLWRLRALYGIKNFIGKRIVALGGVWGKYDEQAPAVAREKYGIDIIELSYDELERRMANARADNTLLAKVGKWTEEYLSQPNITLATQEKYVRNAFLLYAVIKEWMREHDSLAFTIKNCMSKVLPIAATTPCLPLSWLNDEGLLAFCESDFVVIPSGILLHYVSGRPVFLHNSTFPHQAVVTCAHCSAPRRMDGRNYEATDIMTHYESDFGAAPKVKMALGQEVTFIDPEYSSGRWVGFKGIIKANPSYDICRTQQDVEIQGDWKRLIKEVRDSHWMMAYGDYLKELGYACRKLGIKWVNISETCRA
jgi:L-fucose isomerase-like protein